MKTIQEICAKNRHTVCSSEVLTKDSVIITQKLLRDGEGQFLRLLRVALQEKETEILQHAETVFAKMSALKQPRKFAVFIANMVVLVRACISHIEVGMATAGDAAVIIDGRRYITHDSRSKSNKFIPDGNISGRTVVHILAKAACDEVTSSPGKKRKVMDDFVSNSSHVLKKPDHDSDQVARKKPDSDADHVAVPRPLNTIQELVLKEICEKFVKAHAKKLYMQIKFEEDNPISLGERIYKSLNSVIAEVSCLIAPDTLHKKTPLKRKIGEVVAKIFELEKRQNRQKRVIPFCLSDSSEGGGAGLPPTGFEGFSSLGGRSGQRLLPPVIPEFSSCTMAGGSFAFQNETSLEILGSITISGHGSRQSDPVCNPYPKIGGAKPSQAFLSTENSFDFTGGFSPVPVPLSLRPSTAAPTISPELK
jgi:hypothetical protein